MWRARRKLRRAQRNGLKVIAVAGSYGKTSLKHSVHHVLSNHFFTLMTPASYNTPLGIAHTITTQLRNDHQCFIVELGEYQKGDIDMLLELVRPDFGILTPVGFAHMERFKTRENLLATFAEMFTSQWAPTTVLIDDQNRSLLSPPTYRKIIWYGSKAKSDIQLRDFTSDLYGSSFTVRFQNRDLTATTPLLAKHQIHNALPGLWLTATLNHSWTQAARSLQYHIPISRRLEVHRNPNNTWVIDNSYNTNPGSWKESVEILEQFQEKKRHGSRERFC
ncbi:hypothetical protein LRY60_03790 [Candidatus Woesebacteria bacterium]|nr:hypothetical protein [Candidatus Woesebacteria bacterium]